MTGGALRVLIAELINVLMLMVMMEVMVLLMRRIGRTDELLMLRVMGSVLVEADHRGGVERCSCWCRSAARVGVVTNGR